MTNKNNVSKNFNRRQLLKAGAFLPLLGLIPKKELINEGEIIRDPILRTTKLVYCEKNDDDYINHIMSDFHNANIDFTLNHFYDNRYKEANNKPYTNDYVIVPTFNIEGSVDWDKKYTTDRRDDIIERALMVLYDSNNLKIKENAWHCMLAEAVYMNGDRGVSPTIDKNLSFLLSSSNYKEYTIFVSSECVEKNNWLKTNMAENDSFDLILHSIKSTHETGNPITFTFMIEDDIMYEDFYRNELGQHLPEDKHLAVCVPRFAPNNVIVSSDLMLTQEKRDDDRHSIKGQQEIGICSYGDDIRLAII